jgi:hypothetical protein
MASPTIQFKRGLVQNLPGLRAGEPGFATDRSDFYVGLNSTTEGNKFFGSSRYWIREDGTNSLKLNLVDKSGNNGVRLAAPDTLAGITTYTLPATPTEGYFLKTDANGVLSWTSVTASATFENATLTGVSTITNAVIQSGSINGTTVGLTTAAAGAFTTLGANSLNVSGIATVGSVSIGATQVVSSAFQLQNIASLDATTTATIEAAIANAPNTFTDLSVTGISTFNGAVNLGSDSSDIITVKGTTTFEQPVVGTISTATALQNSRDFSITGDFITAPVISFNGTSNVAFAATLTANSIALGTYTTGNYVSTVAGTTNQISVSGSGSETASVTLSLPSDVVVGTSLSAPTVKTSNVNAENGTAAITIDAGGNVGVSTNLTVTGNLFVNGTTTQVNTTSLTVEDTLVELGMVDGLAPGTDLNKDLGLLLNYFSGSAKKAAVYWDDSVDRFAIASEVSEASSVLTAAAYAALEVGSLYINNACTGGVQEVIGCANGQLTLSNIVVDGGSF